MEYVLQVKDLEKQYGHFKALSHVSMNIPKGAIYGFVGKNGAGKTTLIRIICGLQEPTKGEYSLYGRRYTDNDIGKLRRRMGAIVETPSIYLNMTAEENLKQQYLVLGRPSYDGIDELLDLVGLSKTGKKKAKNFSLGMRQRLGIAVALAGSPDFLVLDEPVNGLDPQGIIEIRELILKLNREKKITVLISSHILGELSRIATYYGFIDQGSIIREMSSKDLEAACRSCIQVEVSDTKLLFGVLEERGIEYRVLSDTEAEIYGKITISDLAMGLAERGGEVISMRERNESLEGYYMRLIGGGRDE